MLANRENVKIVYDNHSEGEESGVVTDIHLEWLRQIENVF